MIYTRTATINESQADPQPRGPLITKPRNIQTQKLMSWQKDQNRLRMQIAVLEREATRTTLGGGQRGERGSNSIRAFTVANREGSCGCGSGGTIYMDVLEIWPQPIRGRMC